MVHARLLTSDNSPPLPSRPTFPSDNVASSLFAAFPVKPSILEASEVRKLRRAFSVGHKCLFCSCSLRSRNAIHSSDARDEKMTGNSTSFETLTYFLYCADPYCKTEGALQSINQSIGLLRNGSQVAK